MSVWTSIEGMVEIPLTSHYSLRKGIEQIDLGWETSKPVIEEASRSSSAVTYRVSFAFSDDGISAAEQIRAWLDTLPENCRVDIVSHVRWLR